MATTLPRANLNEQVYDTLRRRILSRSVGPGTKLSLHELATELGVSRSPVHHALTRLVSEDLLTVKARRGYYVAPVTEKALEDGYDVRLALELHAARSTVGDLDRRQLVGLRDRLDATAAALSHEEWDAANASFHEYQVDLAGNDLLTDVYRDLSVNQMMQVIRAGRVEGGEYLVTEHAAIVEAFEAGSLEAAEAAIRAHVTSGLRIAIDAVERSGGVL